MCCAVVLQLNYQGYPIPQFTLCISPLPRPQFSLYILMFEEISMTHTCVWLAFQDTIDMLLADMPSYQSVYQVVANCLHHLTSKLPTNPLGNQASSSKAGPSSTNWLMKRWYYVVYYSCGSCMWVCCHQSQPWRTNFRKSWTF